MTRFDSLIVRTPEQFRDQYDIEVRTGHEVVEIDPAAQRLRIRNHDADSDLVEPYDQLLIATGARPFCPEVSGMDADGVFGLSTLASGMRVHEFIAEHSPRTAVVIGGGYIGLEMAEALSRLGTEGLSG